MWCPEESLSLALHMEPPLPRGRSRRAPARGTPPVCYTTSHFHSAFTETQLGLVTNLRLHPYKPLLDPTRAGRLPLALGLWPWLSQDKHCWWWFGSGHKTRVRGPLSCSEGPSTQDPCVAGQLPDPRSFWVALWGACWKLQCCCFAGHQLP